MSVQTPNAATARPAALRTAHALRRLVVMTFIIAMITSAAMVFTSVSPAAAAAANRSSLIVSVVPVGGDMPNGSKQTRSSALQQIDWIKNFGGRGIRVNIDMIWMCSRSGCDFSMVDPLVDRARARGLSVYLHVNSSPSWIAKSRWTGPEGAGATAWAKLFAKWTARYGTRVQGYEVWNEPNIRAFWAQGPNPKAYARLMKQVWVETRRVSPRAQLVAGNLSNNDIGYWGAVIRELKALGGNRSNGFFYNKIGVHPYSGNATSGWSPSLSAGSRRVHISTGEKDMTFRGFGRLRSFIHRQEGIARNVVIGEFGYDSKPGRWYHVSDRTRASYLVSAMRHTKNISWIDGLTIYGFNDTDRTGFQLRGTRSFSAVVQAARNGSQLSATSSKRASALKARIAKKKAKLRRVERKLRSAKRHHHRAKARHLRSKRTHLRKDIRTIRVKLRRLT